MSEPAYLNKFKQHEQNLLVDVTIDDQGGVPKTLVERAVAMKKEAEKEARRRRDDFLKYDEVWCVFDIDDHPNVPDALQQARANKIQICLSNPCFELWLLLHFQDQRAHLGRAQAQEACREHMPDYRKEPPFETLLPHYEEAVTRAAALEKWQREQDRPSGNPSTGFHRLTQRIRELGKNSMLRELNKSIAK